MTQYLSDGRIVTYYDDTSAQKQLFIVPANIICESHDNAAAVIGDCLHMRGSSPSELSILQWNPKNCMFADISAEQYKMFQKNLKKHGDIQFKGIYGVIPIAQMYVIILITQLEDCGISPQHGKVYRITEMAPIELPGRESFIADRGLDAKQRLDDKSLEKYFQFILLFCNLADYAGGRGFLVCFNANIAQRNTPHMNAAVHLSNSPEGSATPTSILAIDQRVQPRRYLHTTTPLGLFQWNRLLYDVFPDTRHVVPVTRGYFGSCEISKGLFVAVCCRLSCRRAGTRYHRRGLDNFDLGVTANFSETEQLVWHLGGTITSYVMIRGSVPLRWKQLPDFRWKPKVFFCELKTANDDFYTHLNVLFHVYSSMQVMCVNLMTECGVEKDLTEGFKSVVENYNKNINDVSGCTEQPYKHCSNGFLNGDTATNNSGRRSAVPLNASACACELTNFRKVGHVDYNMDVKMKRLKTFSSVSDDLIDVLRKEYHKTFKKLPDDDDDDDDDDYQLQPFGSFTSWSSSNDSSLLSTQSVLLRINCIDCLDRTNVAHCIIGMHVLLRQLQQVSKLDNLGVDLDKYHLSAENTLRTFYEQQGNCLSDYYAGTEAHFQLKSTTSFNYNVVIALRRYLNQNLRDGPKQDVITLLTGEHDPLVNVEDGVQHAVCRSDKFAYTAVVVGLVIPLFMFVLNVIEALVLSEDGISSSTWLMLVGWPIIFFCIAYNIFKYGRSVARGPKLL